MTTQELPKCRRAEIAAGDVVTMGNPTRDIITDVWTVYGVADTVAGPLAVCVGRYDRLAIVPADRLELA